MKRERTRSLGVRVGGEKEDEEVAARECPKREVRRSAAYEMLPRRSAMRPWDGREGEKRERDKRSSQQ